MTGPKTSSAPRCGRPAIVDDAGATKKPSARSPPASTALAAVTRAPSSRARSTKPRPARGGRRRRAGRPRSRVERVADADLLARRGQALEELVADALVDEEARGGDADLAVRHVDPFSASATAASMSASAQITNGALAAELEHRRRQVLGRGAAMIARAVAMPPVKVILATPGCATSAAPTSGPKPVTTLRTPAGSSPDAVRTNSTTLAEANSDGFSTTVLPAASAGADL